jgi:aminoglycoside/choline kinase family phosphotransferase
MPGGASTRRYFRVRLPAGSAVGMYVPHGGTSEEVMPEHGPSSVWPFLEIRELLASRGVEVPALYAEDTARGWVLLEDLGPSTLLSHLVAYPDQRERLYKQAVSDLARAQVSMRALPDGCVVNSRVYDEAILRSELEHFRQWVLETRGASLKPADRHLWDGIADRLARRIASCPREFVHRDYQSRNLMVRDDGRLAWIDFQDALLGPRVYDLAALLGDSHQAFDRAFVEARIEDYARARGLSAETGQEIRREFDVVTVHRKLKGAGRFVYLDRAKNNPAFLGFVGPSLLKARAALARLHEDADMRALDSFLARVAPALASPVSKV